MVHWILVKMWCRNYFFSPLDCIEYLYLFIISGCCCENSHGTRVSCRTVQGIFERGLLLLILCSMLNIISILLKVLNSFLLLLGCNYEATTTSKYCSVYGCSHSAPKLVHSDGIFIKVLEFLLRATTTKVCKQKRKEATLFFSF